MVVSDGCGGSEAAKRVMPVDLASHTFVIPKKEISQPADIQLKWETSQV